jgi:hypothetical protein
MKRRSRAGGKSAKAQPSESLKLKPDIVPKAAAGRRSAMQQTADWLERLGLGNTLSALLRMTSILSSCPI